MMNCESESNDYVRVYIPENALVIKQYKNILSTNADNLTYDIPVNSRIYHVTANNYGLNYRIRGYANKFENRKCICTCQSPEIRKELNPQVPLVSIPTGTRLLIKNSHTNSESIKITDKHQKLDISNLYSIPIVLPKNIFIQEENSCPGLVTREDTTVIYFVKPTSSYL